MTERVTMGIKGTSKAYSKIKVIQESSSFGPADFRDIVMFCQAVQVTVEILNSPLVSFFCFVQNPLHLPLLLHLVKCNLSWCSFVNVSTLGLLLFVSICINLLLQTLLLFVLLLLFFTNGNNSNPFQFQGAFLCYLGSLGCPNSNVTPVI